MPLNKERLLAHLKASKKPTIPKPALPKTPAIKAAEKIEQDVKKATGADKVEKEVDRNVTKASSAPDVKSVAEASLPKALMKKLLDGDKLTSDDQKAVAAVCKAAGYL